MCQPALQPSVGQAVCFRPSSVTPAVLEIRRDAAHRPQQMNEMDTTCEGVDRGSVPALGGKSPGPASLPLMWGSLISDLSISFS